MACEWPATPTPPRERESRLSVDDAVHTTPDVIDLLKVPIA
jgi:hypothetical protein